MKKTFATITTLFAVMMVFGMFVVSVKAVVEPGVTTNPVPAGYGYIGFEEGTDSAVIQSTIPGLHFTTTAGFDWIYGDARTGLWNVRSLTDPAVNHGDYVVNGYFFAWLGPNQGQGRIDFILGTASYISILVSCNTQVTMDAYDSSNNLIATSGTADANYGTFTFTRLTIQTPGIAYVLIHDTGNFWEIDDLVTDAPGVPQQFVPETPFGTILASTFMVIGFLAYVGVPRLLRTRKPENL